ncbi:hypothetical protein F4782DRAFT_528655 [Xylaria castorea]|nr:hypothetical protein F4782DRAFT_528655 [Xylaria castorea]
MQRGGVSKVDEHLNTKRRGVSQYCESWSCSLAEQFSPAVPETCIQYSLSSGLKTARSRTQDLYEYSPALEPSRQTQSSSMPRSDKSDSYSSLGGIQTVLARIRNEGWTFCQLTEILKGLLGHDHSKKFCFIIDGLDEYKSQHTQDQQVLVDNLRKLATSPNIKLCVSSRPFTVFLDAFNGGVSQCLKLEDLTKGDIRSYALDKLSGHNQFRKLTQIDPDYATLVDEVVTKSQDVFLRGFLVLRELFDGLTFNDTIGIMRQRLKSFPATIEDFFLHMLDTIDKIYLYSRPK